MGGLKRSLRRKVKGRPKEALKRDFSGELKGYGEEAEERAQKSA